MIDDSFDDQYDVCASDGHTDDYDGNDAADSADNGYDDGNIVEHRTDNDNIVERNDDAADSEDTADSQHAVGSEPSFVGGGWDCTCYGSCLCKHYVPKSTYDTDCKICGHKVSDHTPR